VTRCTNRRSERFVLYCGTRPLGRFEFLSDAVAEARMRGLI